MKKIVIVFVMALGGLLITAGTNQLLAFERGACRADIEKYCKNITPGGGRTHECLKKHQKNLSSACQENIKERDKKRESAWGPCHNEIQKYCKNVTPGQGRIFRCLKRHESKLSDACREHCRHHRQMM